MPLMPQPRPATDPSRGERAPMLRLTAVRPGQPSITGQVLMRVGAEPLSVEITVPTAPTPTEDLLPVFQGLTNAVVERGVKQAVGEGRSVSCRAGCGACCSQLVPISESEARNLARLVEAMPEPRRSAVRARFAQVQDRLEAHGLLARLKRAFMKGGDSSLELGLAYMRAGAPCPFLEAQSCSIHPDRPLACREYLVTSPPEACTDPTPEGIRMVKLAARPSLALMAQDWAATAVGWVPLALALDLADEHPAKPPAAPAPELVQKVFGHVGKGLGGA